MSKDVDTIIAECNAKRERDKPCMLVGFGHCSHDDYGLFWAPKRPWPYTAWRQESPWTRTYWLERGRTSEITFFRVGALVLTIPRRWWPHKNDGVSRCSLCHQEKWMPRFAHVCHDCHVWLMAPLTKYNGVQR